MSQPKEKIATVSQVPLLDLKAQYASLRTEIEAAIREVCESQWFVMGPNVVELEAKIAEYSNAAFGIGVSSGTDALLVALMALDIGPGDESHHNTLYFFCDWWCRYAAGCETGLLRYRSGYFQSGCRRG